MSDDLTMALKTLRDGLHKCATELKDGVASTFDDYFDEKHEEFFDSEETGCKETREKLIKIFEKYFTNSGVYENEFIKIELKQPWFQNFACDKGVDIKL